jgi:hypothetical protein
MLAEVTNPTRSSVRTHGVPRDQNRKNFRAETNNNSDTSSTSWGNKIIVPKPEHIFRFTLQNIQGLPVNPTSHKHQQIGTAITETASDVAGLVELNLNFPVMGPAFQWSERFRHIRRHHSVHTCNKHDSSKKRILFGGTAQITTGKSSHRVSASGADETGMGRWVWTLFAGRNKTKLRVISGYRPNPDNQDRPGTVYSQQERHLRAINDDRNPRRAFTKDLETKIEQWMIEGNLLIIGLDANDNVRTGEVNAMLRNKGLIEVHAAAHPHLPPTATCNKNTQEIPVYGRHHL